MISTSKEQIATLQIADYLSRYCQGTKIIDTAWLRDDALRTSRTRLDDFCVTHLWTPQRQECWSLSRRSGYQQKADASLTARHKPHHGHVTVIARALEV
jgi:hypothetical protein